MRTEQLNALSADALTDVLEDWGGSRAWAEAVAAWRPFADEEALLAASDAAWIMLADEHMRASLEAAPAPVIQHGDAGARAAALVALRLYHERFGYPYFSYLDTDVAEVLLMRVRIRLGNEPKSEWRAARDHLRRAVHTRLALLLQGVSA